MEGKLRLPRIVAITITLGLMGAAVGGLLGIVAIAFVGLVQQGPSGVLDATVLFPAAGGVGAVAGAALAPIAAWCLMRHVPIWRAIAETAAGTLLGVAIGYTLRPSGHLAIAWLLGGGLAGFLAAAIRLRLGYSPVERHARAS